jgi:hypothetical protein
MAYAPPPVFCATLFESTQLFNVPDNAPAPKTAEFPTMTQFDMHAPGDWARTPPPPFEGELDCVAPLVKVKPISTALVAK